MTQRVVVNGVEYDSLDAMPPDVRQQYERAVNALKHIGEQAGDVKVNVTTHVRYSINGKTYESPSGVPAEVRPFVDRAFVEISRPQRRGGTVLVWILIAVIAVLVVALLR
jgi:hypothetical protein